MNDNWKTGDVAIVTDDRGTERVAVHGTHNPRMKHDWHYDENGIGRILVPLRRLVVIDPEDREQVERLAKAIRGAQESHGQAFWEYDQMALIAALREFANPTPPKPEEPTGLGAVVECEDGAIFVRSHMTVANPWTRAGFGDWTSWDSIAAVRVLSEGVANV